MGIFDFLKRLFGSQEPPRPRSQVQCQAAPSRPSQTKAAPPKPSQPVSSFPLQELLSQIQGKGRPEYPFLHATYSPTSRVPCADFTPFIIGRLAAGDVGAIGQLMREIIAANPGLGTRGEWIEEEVEKTIRAPLEKYLRFADPDAYRQLRAMWIIAAKGGGGREFWLTNESTLYFAQALSPYDLELPPALEDLRKKANSFIRKMRKDAPYWDEVPLFRANELTIPTLPAGEAVARVRRMTIGARLHLFRAVAAGGGRLPNLTRLIPRDMGLYPPDSSREILESGLLTPSQDAELLKDSLQKTEILEACDQVGASYKKSWNKDKLLQALLSAPPERIGRFVADAGLAAVNPEQADCLEALLTRAQQLEPVFKVLCFA